jgi:uncharacterized protein YggE
MTHALTRPFRLMLAPTLAILCALGLAALTPAGIAAAAEDEPKPRLMSLTGKGEVTTSPDMAVLSIGVVSEDRTARQALFANTRSMTALVEAMKAGGVEPKDLQTSGFNVNPKYSRPRRTQAGPQPPPEIVGYTVRNTLTVRIRDLGSAGEILDEAVSLGSNAISGLTFTVAEPKPLQNEARKAAIADALEKAKLYADGAGITLGPIQSITEGGGARPPRPIPMARAQAEVAFDGAVPIEAGELTYRAQVSVVWEIRE